MHLVSRVGLHLAVLPPRREADYLAVTRPPQHHPAVSVDSAAPTIIAMLPVLIFLVQRQSLHLEARIQEVAYSVAPLQMEDLALRTINQ